MVAVIVRLALSDRENKALLSQVRTDPLTGLLSRGALQIDLDGLCAKATDQQPITVLLFDLNGFKSYNDTCGHPAGDELLAVLGGRLKARVGDDGFAYRVGGDEFCVVLTRTARSVDELTREAAIALSTRKNGIDVSASWGSVAIPAEAEEPREALQLADVRMYAQKESRRVASRGRERDPLVVPLEPPASEPDLERRGAPQEPGSVEA
jgi:two-component system cell cycle response regulator